MSSDTTSEKKLWIGNLDKRLSEFNLLKLIQRYGEVENFEYLFHTVGPNKGEPRTYCFVEYKKREDAELALQKLNGHVVLSQTLKVRWAKDHVKNKGNIFSCGQFEKVKDKTQTEKCHLVT